MGSPETSPRSFATGRDRLTRRLRHGGISIMLGRGAGMATVLLTFVFLARNSSSEVLAAYVLTTSLVAFLSAGAMFGLNTLVCRYLSASFAVGDTASAGIALKRILWLALIISLLVGNLTSLALPLLANSLFDMPMIEANAAPIGLWVVLLACGQVVAECFRGLHRLRVTALVCGVSGGLVSNVIFLLGLVICSHSEEIAFHQIVASSLLSLLLPAVASTFYLWRVWPRGEATRQDVRTSKLTHRAVLWEAWPIVMARLAGFGMAQLDIWIVGICCSPTDLAVYGIIRRLSQLVAVPLTQINLTVASSIAELHAQGDRENLQRILRGAATVGAMLAALPALILFAFPTSLLEFAFHASYQVGAQPLRVLLLGQIVFALTGPCGTALMMTGYQRVSLYAVLSVLPVFALAPWAATSLGLLGAASVFAVAIASQNLIQSIVVARFLGLVTRPSFSPQYIRGLLTV